MDADKASVIEERLKAVWEESKKDEATLLHILESRRKNRREGMMDADKRQQIEKKGCVFTTPTNWLKMGDDEQRYDFEMWLRSIGFEGLPRDSDGYYQLHLRKAGVLLEVSEPVTSTLVWRVNGRVLEQEVTDKWDVLLMLDVLGIKTKGTETT